MLCWFLLYKKADIIKGTLQQGKSVFNSWRTDHETLGEEKSPGVTRAIEFFPGKNTRVGCHFLLQGNLPNPGIEPMSPVSPALAGGFITTEPPGRPLNQREVKYSKEFFKWGKSV